MTIKVTITNSDNRETAVISVSVYGCSNPPDSDRPTQPVTELKGGESMEAYVHPHQYIMVRESHLAARVDPAYK